MSLFDLLVDAAVDLPGVEAVRSGDGSLTWTRTGRAFATLSSDGRVASFGLDPAVAAAAIRTPDTAPSPMGSGWVAFTPAEVDDHAADRAEAWFASAHRRLGPRD